MCAQCVMGAAAAAAGASGLRAWLAARRFRWLPAARLRLVSGGLVAAAVLAAGARFG